MVCQLGFVKVARLEIHLMWVVDCLGGFFFFFFLIKTLVLSRALKQVDYEPLMAVLSCLLETFPRYVIFYVNLEIFFKRGSCFHYFNLVLICGTHVFEATNVCCLI